MPPPVITLLGSANVTVTLLNSYTDAGATAVVPGYVITLSVKTVGTVNTSQAGVYPIMYTAAAPGSALSATPVTRYVQVVDPCLAALIPSFACLQYSNPGAVVCATCASADFCLCLPPASGSNAGRAVLTFTPTVNTVPPVITLLGSGELAVTPEGTTVMIHNLNISAKWVDPGVVAIDQAGIVLTDSVSKAFPLGPVDTSVVSPAAPDGSLVPYVIAYDVTDSAGLKAATVKRRVYVTNPCSGGPAGADERICSDGTCSQNTLCAALSIGGTEGPTGPQPPTLILGGPTYLRMPAGTTYAACPPNSPLTLICDRGAKASDPVDGNLSPQVIACPDEPGGGSRFATNGLAGCRSLAAVSNVGVYNVTFSVTNTAGLTATAVRSLVVYAQCATGERLCLDGVTCSRAGICISDLDAAASQIAGASAADAEARANAPTPPEMTLYTSEVMPTYLSVKQYSTYAPCVDGLPTIDVQCEMGAIAIDKKLGNITSTVLACPPQECLDMGCPGHEFLTKGLNGCIDTTAPPTTIFVINFTSYNDNIPPQYTTVARIITIVPPCPSGENLCDDGACTTMDCNVRKLVLAGLAPVVKTAPPSLTLLGTSPWVLPYGAVVTGVLAPCATWNGSSSVWPLCGAVAHSDLDGDLSSSIFVEQAASGSSGPLCSPLMVNVGVCLPGKYAYRYSVVDSLGRTTTAQRSVLVLQNGTVTVTDTQPGGATLAAANATAAALLDTTTDANLAFRVREVVKATSALRINATTPTQVITAANVQVLKTAVAGTAPAYTVSVTFMLYLTTWDNGLPQQGVIEFGAESSDNGMASRRRLLQSIDPGVLATNASLGVILAAAAAALGAPNTTNVVAGITPPLDLESATYASMDALVSTLAQRVDYLSTAVDALSDSYDVSFADRDAWAASTSSAFQSGLDDAVSMHGDLESAVTELLAKLHETFDINTATSGTQAAAQLELLAQQDAMVAVLQQAASELISMGVGVAAPPPPPGPPGGSASSSACSGFQCLCPLRSAGGEVTIRFYVQTYGEYDAEGLYLGPKGSVGSVVGGRRKLSASYIPSSGGASGASAKPPPPKTKAAPPPPPPLQQVGYSLITPTPQYAAEPNLVPRRYVAERNRLVGGLMLHLVRAAPPTSAEPGCSGRFSNLDPPCRGTKNTLAPFSVDPVFNAKAALFNADLFAHSLNDYYNNATELNSLGAPYGFFSRKLDGFDDGFPIFIDTQSPSTRALEIVDYLTQAFFMDGWTRQMTVRAVMFNPDLQYFAFTLITFDFTTIGNVAVTGNTTPLPIYSYDISTTDGLIHLLLQLLLIVQVAQAATEEVNTVSDVIRKHKTEVREALRIHFSNIWNVINSWNTLLQLANIAVWWFYVLYVTARLSVLQHYDVYDDPSFTPARYLLQKKVDPPKYVAPPGAQLLDNPAAPPRWSLPEDLSGLHGFVDMINYFEGMSLLLSLYWFLEAGNIALMIARIMQYLNFQPRASLVTRTIAAMSGDLGNLLAVCTLLITAMAMVTHIGFGWYIEPFSTYTTSVEFFWCAHTTALSAGLLFFCADMFSLLRQELLHRRRRQLRRHRHARRHHCAGGHHGPHHCGAFVHHHHVHLRAQAVLPGGAGRRQQPREGGGRGARGARHRRGGAHLRALRAEQVPRPRPQLRSDA